MEIWWRNFHVLINWMTSLRKVGGFTRVLSFFTKVIRELKSLRRFLNGFFILFKLFGLLVGGELSHFYFIVVHVAQRRVPPTPSPPGCLARDSNCRSRLRVGKHANQLVTPHPSAVPHIIPFSAPPVLFFLPIVNIWSWKLEFGNTFSHNFLVFLIKCNSNIWDDPLFSHRDLVLVAVLPEGGGGEPLLDEGLRSVHDCTACPHILYFST